MSLRLLLVGNSGTGKTGSLLPLLKNYTLRICDFDDSSFWRLNTPPDLRPNLQRKIFKDIINHSAVQGHYISGKTAISRMGEALDKWDDQGPVKKWDHNTILVIDSLSLLCLAMVREFKQINKIPLDNPVETRQYGSIQQMITGFLDALHADTGERSDGTFGPHLIVISHLDYRDFEQGTYSPVGMMEQGDKPGQINPARVDVKGVPTTFGAKLGPQVGRYFDFMLKTDIATVKGTDMKARRIIRTAPDATIDVKCPILSLEKKGELPLDSGLDTVFTEWRKLTGA